MEKTVVKMTAVNTGTKSIKLTWKRVEDADGYVVMIKSGNKWKTVKEMKNPKTTSYTYKKDGSEQKVFLCS